MNGVQTAEWLGAKKFALRAWLGSGKLAAYGLTASDRAANSPDIFPRFSYVM